MTFLFMAFSMSYLGPRTQLKHEACSVVLPNGLWWIELCPLGFCYGLMLQEQSPCSIVTDEKTKLISFFNEMNPSDMITGFSGHVYVRLNLFFIISVGVCGLHDVVTHY